MIVLFLVAARVLYLHIVGTIIEARVLLLFIRGVLLEPFPVQELFPQFCRVVLEVAEGVKLVLHHRVILIVCGEVWNIYPQLVCKF